MSDPVVLLSTGDVVGPAGGVTDNSMVLFSGTSGKLIKGNNAVVTTQGLALLDDVDAAANRATIGLHLVNNTSDINKPVSTAQQAALDLKVEVTKQATEAVLGLVKFSTQVQVNTGLDDTTSVTPKKLRFGVALLIATNGYLVLPTWLGGLVFQWGFVTASTNSSGTVTYPISFPTASRGGFLQNQYTTADSNTFMVRQATLLTNAFSESNLSFNWNITNTTRTLSFTWFAWGN